MTQNLDQKTVEASPRIALLGLGVMGHAMAQRLAGCTNDLRVWNRTHERADAIEDTGVSVATTAAEAVKGADIVLMMLADDAAVADVVRGISEELQPGTVLVDLSTVHPQTSVGLHDLVPAGVSVVDAPVMGSADAALNGTLGLLVGADEQVFEEIRYVLSLLGNPTRVGQPGSGSAAKVAAMSAIIPSLVAVGEGLAVGRSLGLSEDTLRAVFAHTPVGAITQRVFAEHANYATRLAAKDLGLAERSNPTPIVGHTREMLLASELPDQDLGRAAIQMTD